MLLFQQCKAVWKAYQCQQFLNLKAVYSAVQPPYLLVFSWTKSLWYPTPNSFFWFLFFSSISWLLSKSLYIINFFSFFSVSPLRGYFPPVSSAISICSALRRSSKILTQTTPLCSFQICQTFHYQHLHYFNNQIQNWLYLFQQSNPELIVSSIKYLQPADLRSRAGPSV